MTARDPASAESGHGFSWASVTLPFVDQTPLHDRLNFGEDCRTPDNVSLGATSLSVFRCPSDSGKHRDQFPVTSAGQSYDLALANYVGILGYGSVTMTPGAPMEPGVFYRNSNVRIADIRDGTSNTIMVGERSQVHDFVPGEPVEAPSTWYAAVPRAMRPAGMPGMMSMMREGPGSLVLGHVGQPGMGSMMPMHHTPNHTNHIVNFSSQHPDGMHFVGCDGSVHFLAASIEFELFRRLGQRSDGKPVEPF